MTEIDLSDWLTKYQAAEAIGVSTKAIERFAQAKKLEQRFRPQARGPQVAVYHPDDVARLAQARQPGAAPFVVPAGPAITSNSNGSGIKNILSRTEHLVPPGDPLRLFTAALVRAVMSQTSETSPLSATLFVTIREAAAITGLTQAYLRRQLEAGTLPAIRDRGWRIRRKDLEAL